MGVPGVRVTVKVSLSILPCGIVSAGRASNDTPVGNADR